MAEKTVEAYIASRTGLLRDTMTHLDTIARKAAPKATATVKWGQPVYEQNGPVAWMKASAKHVSFGFWRGAQLTDPKGLLEGSGELMRHIKLGSPADVPKTQIAAWMKEGVKLNEARGTPVQKKNW